MKPFVLICISLVALYLLGGAILFVLQRGFLYFPPNTYLSPQAVNLAHFTEVEITARDDTELKMWWHKPEDDKPVIMFFHGNASGVFSNVDIYRDLTQAGFGVLGVSYPGYPGAGGKTSQNANISAAQAQYDWLLAQNIRPEKIIFFGTSLGAGVAAQLSKTHPPALLIMEAPFNSMLDMVRLRMPLYGFSVWLIDEYRSDLALQNATFPVLILHGSDDRVIPAAQSAKLEKGLKGAVTRHLIEGGQHTNLWALGGHQIIFELLENY